MSSLEFGSWMPDGYYQKGCPNNFRSNPKRKLKDPSADFKRVGRATSEMISALLERPSIMVIDDEEPILTSLGAALPLPRHLLLLIE